MPIIPDAAAAKRLREALRQTNKHERLKANRKIRDCLMEPELMVFRSALAENLQASFVPFQDPEPDKSVILRAHILAANEQEFEVISKSRDPKVLRDAQAYEEAIEALFEALITVELKLDECDGIIGDGRTVYCIERRMGDELKHYADRQALQNYAERKLLEGSLEPADSNQEPQGEPEEPYPQVASMEDRRRKQAMDAYADAYASVIDERRKELERAVANPGARMKRRPTDPHDEAYQQVTREALRQAPLPWTARIVDPETNWLFEDTPGHITLAMEDGWVPMNPVMKALEGYGVTLEDGRWKLTREDEQGQEKQTLDESAYGLSVLAENATDPGSDGQARVRWTRISTLEETVVLLEHPQQIEGAEVGELIRFSNQFDGRSTGYYIIGGDTKIRGTFEERYQSPTRGMYQMAQVKNYALSAALAMAFEEATREPVAIGAKAKVPPADTTQDRKALQIKGGQLPPTLGAGTSLERVPSTGIDVMAVAQFFDEMTQRFRSDQYMSGSGSSSESGLHLARMQTAFMTEMQPYQEKRAAVYKRILMDICAAEAAAGRTLFVPYVPKGPREAGANIRVAEPREITPEMSLLPVDLRVTIGAESPETKYAREQASRSEVAFGARSMTTHQEVTGVKDPDNETRRIARDQLIKAAIVGDGLNPGWMITMITGRLQERVNARLDRFMPPAPPQTPAPVNPAAAAGNGAVNDGTAGVGNAPGAQLPAPVQTNEGSPVSPGALPATV